MVFLEAALMEPHEQALDLGAQMAGPQPPVAVLEAALAGFEMKSKLCPKDRTGGRKQRPYETPSSAPEATSHSDLCNSRPSRNVF